MNKVWSQQSKSYRLMLYLNKPGLLMVFKLINYLNINFYYPNAKGKEGVMGGGGEGRRERRN